MFPNGTGLMHSRFTILAESLEVHTKLKIQKVVKRWSEITHFCMTTILAKSCHDIMTI